MQYSATDYSTSKVFYHTHSINKIFRNGAFYQKSILPWFFLQIKYFTTKLAVKKYSTIKACCILTKHFFHGAFYQQSIYSTTKHSVLQIYPVQIHAPSIIGIRVQATTMISIRASIIGIRMVYYKDRGRGSDHDGNRNSSNHTGTCIWSSLMTDIRIHVSTLI